MAWTATATDSMGTTQCGAALQACDLPVPVSVSAVAAA